MTTADAHTPPPGRGIFCNRTLNLRSIHAVGYDMDYTLIHYRVDQWERRAFEHIRQRLSARGWPVDDVTFDPDAVTRGLVIDTELGNVVKANRFGFVKRAFHGTRALQYDEWRGVYARTQVDLGEPRWVFLNTLFSISEACMYMHLVELLDARRIPEVMGYPELYAVVRRTLDEAHMEGELKREIVSDPDRFVELDPDVPLALLDQKTAGKKLLLITNSEWDYTAAMMKYAFDRFLPTGTTWRDLFHLVMVSARKPDFFSTRTPVYEVQTDTGLLRPFPTGFAPGGVYHGGNAHQVERHLGVGGDDILYVGDHMFTDVHISKSILRWRTALIVRELEAEIEATVRFAPDQARLDGLMAKKERLEFAFSQLRVQLQRGRAPHASDTTTSAHELERRMGELRQEMLELDSAISPLARTSGELFNRRWGPLMRAGNDKSHLARQVERYADIYMSRVSNFLFQTPFVYLRSPRGSLPHDPIR
ncbi:MAG: HAD-IG family 5'-nucleotidase [Deltaproteobacteria bacterium]|nr:HAD-IG family 5'-nucleotidase [Deltaproteobacteria bacterium]